MARTLSSLGREFGVGLTISGGLLTLPCDRSYLVRDAVRKGKTLNIAGDLSNSVSLLVFAPPDIESVLWNGQDVGARKNDWSAWAAELVGPETLEPIVTDLASWRYADSLPEVGDFDDSDWVDADHTSTGESRCHLLRDDTLTKSPPRQPPQAVQELRGQVCALRGRLWVSSGQSPLPWSL